MSYGVSSSSRRWKYDVFLSFCGQDTRTNFTDFLFNWLVRDGIHTFRDTEELNRGEDISTELMEAIQGCRIAIIIFSKNYASSTWCLSELAKILDCKKDGQIEKVLPVFFKVDPSDVRHQRNTYEEAFKKHEERFKDEMGKVEKWKEALTKAANLSGWDQIKVANGHEAELTKKIVEEVLRTVNKTRLHVAEHPIGLDSHIERICCLLKDGSDDVCIIGIYGSGGIGKTTIAKAVFNEMCKKFEGSKFLANVREISSQQNGLARLQKMLLSGVLNRKEIEIDIDNEDEGIIIIKERLCFKRVIIVLDDVEETEQFYKLVAGRDSFGPGSRIIITTRDEHLLTGLDVDDKYKYRVEMMNQNDSLQLFSRHAFRQNHPLEDFVQLSNDVIDYAGGLPLALVILGSLLYKRSQDEWERELKKLRKIPNGRILEKLEISYNALDDSDQTIFLDISCFLTGEDKDIVITFLDACGLGGEAGIKLLTERSLVTIDGDNMLCMHDLIRDLGREIVRRQSPRKRGERSRLWDYEEALDVFINLTGTEAVEGLQLDLRLYNVEEFGLLTTEGFSKMHNLRLLKVNAPGSSSKAIYWEHSLQERVYRFRKLVWVRWKGFPFEYIPNNFFLGNLVILDMQYSKLKEVWKGTKNLTKLKELNLSNSYYLTHTPNFSGVPNLEKLILKSCESLVEIHESIDRLKNLIILDMQQMTLKEVWTGTKYLTKLKELNLSESPYLTCTPDFSGLLNLEKLILNNCESLSEVHESIDCLTKLVNLEIRNCSNLKNLPSGISKLTALETLDVFYCSKLENLPEGMENLKRLTMLHVGDTVIEELPSSPSSLHSLDASSCWKLKRLPNLSNLKHLTMLNLSDCKKLTEIEGLESLKSTATINLEGCINLESFVKRRIFQDLSKELLGNLNVCDIILSGKEFPEWFGFQSESLSDPFSCKVPPQTHNMEIQGLVICFVCSEITEGIGYYSGARPKTAVLVLKTKNITWRHEIILQFYFKNITCVITIPHCVWKSTAEDDDDDTINVSVERSHSYFDNFVVKKIGVHFFS